MGQESRGRVCQSSEWQKALPTWEVKLLEKGVDSLKSSNLIGVIVQSIDKPAFEFSFGSIPCSAFWITAVGTLNEEININL